MRTLNGSVDLTVSSRWSGSIVARVRLFDTISARPSPLTSTRSCWVSDMLRLSEAPAPSEKPKPGVLTEPPTDKLAPTDTLFWHLSWALGSAVSWGSSEGTRAVHSVEGAAHSCGAAKRYPRLSCTCSPF